MFISWQREDFFPPAPVWEDAGPPTGLLKLVLPLPLLRPPLLLLLEKVFFDPGLLRGRKSFAKSMFSTSSLVLILLSWSDSVSKEVTSLANDEK